MPRMRSAGVIVWKNRAFVPSQAITDSGLLMQVDPVYELELSAEALGPVLYRVLTSELPRIKNQTQSEWRTRKDPVLVKTGAKSWRELARMGAGGGIAEVPDGYLVSFSRRTSKGDWQEDLGRRKHFPSSTLFAELTKVLLDGLLSSEKVSG